MYTQNNELYKNLKGLCPEFMSGEYSKVWLRPQPESPQNLTLEWQSKESGIASISTVPGSESIHAKITAGINNNLSMQGYDRYDLNYTAESRSGDEWAVIHNGRDSTALGLDVWISDRLGKVVNEAAQEGYVLYKAWDRDGNEVEGITLDVSQYNRTGIPADKNADCEGCVNLAGMLGSAHAKIAQLNERVEKLSNEVNRKEILIGTAVKEIDSLRAELISSKPANRPSLEETQKMIDNARQSASAGKSQQKESRNR